MKGVLTLYSTLKRVYKHLIFNLKPLLLFEAFYRLLGVFVVFPIVSLLFQWSISASGYPFITNTVILNYLFLPSTIAIFILIALILSTYLVIELIYLAILFNLGHQGIQIKFLPFILLGLKKVWKIIFKYHLLVILPSFVFLVIVESAHLVGFVSTISIPDYIIDQIDSIAILRPLFFILLFISIVFFIESIFSIHLFSLDRLTLRESYHESRKILKKNRFKMIYQFIITNILINAILYLIYIILISLVALFILITRGQDYLLGFLLTFLYSTYALIGYIATMILVPVNFAMISTWYYQYYEKLGVTKTAPELTEILESKLDLRWVKRGLILSLSVIFILNVTNVYAFVLEPSDNIDLLRKVDIVAHRGASKDAPENTLASIELAIEQGADTIEFDVQMTKDFVPILFHDISIRRTTNVRALVAVTSLTLEEVKSLDAGSWFSDEFVDEKIPTLEEALTLIDGRARIFIDMKNNSTAIDQLVVGLVEEFLMVDKTVILSKSLVQLERIKELNPNIKTLLLISTFYGDPSVLINNTYVDAYGFEKSFVKSSPNLIETVRQGGKKVYVWTLSDAAQIEDILQFSIDGIITSVPYVAREVIYSYRTNDTYLEILRRLFERKT